MINNTKPVIGKQVYDIVLGYGKIISIEPDDAFVVQFSKSKQLRYAAGGYVGQSRRVYWENPIIVEPAADDKKWTGFTKIVRIVYDLLRL